MNCIFGVNMDGSLTGLPAIAFLLAAGLVGWWLFQRRDVVSKMFGAAIIAVAVVTALGIYPPRYINPALGLPYQEPARTPWCDEVQP